MRRLLFGFGTLLTLCGVAMWALADPPPQPTWWEDSTNGTAILNGNTANNHAAATVGQLKFVAYQAQQYLDQQLGSVGGAGPAIDLVINDFVQNTTTNFAVVTTGQLKYVAQPFYDRLTQVGYNTTANLQSRIYYDGLTGNWTSPYPWPTPPAAPGALGYNSTVYNAWMQQNYTPVNLGEIKLVFSFDLGNFTLASNLSINSDGIPDAWKVAYGLDPFDPDIASEDSLSDSMTNYEEYEADSDPPPPGDYTDPIPANFSVAGNSSFLFPSTPLPQYAVADLGSGSVVDMNDNGDVLFQSGNYVSDTDSTYPEFTLFTDGGFVPAPYTDGEGTVYLWEKVANDGTVMGWAWSDPDSYYMSPVIWDGNTMDDPAYPDEDLSDYDLDGIYAFTRDGNMYFSSAYNDEDDDALYRFFDWDSSDSVSESDPILIAGTADPGTPDPIDLQLASACGNTTLDFVFSNFTYGLLDDGVTSELDSVDAQYVVNGNSTPLTSSNVGIWLPSDGDHQFGNLTYPFLLNFDYYYGDSPPSLYYLPGNTASSGNLTDSANGNATVYLRAITAQGVGLTTNGTLWFDGATANFTDLMDAADAATYSDFFPSNLAGNNLFIAGDSGGDAVLLMPVAMSVSNRDDPRAGWSNAQPQAVSAPVYAGNITGDMVSWKIPGTDSWSGVSFVWSALAPDGVTTITGPSGDGANEWRMADTVSTDPNGNTTLTWAPGNYTITCNVTFPDSTSIPITFTQQVGWRTDNYLVIGQIVTTNAYSNSTYAPALVSFGNNAWDISSPTYEFRQAVIGDMLDILTPISPLTSTTATDALAATPAPITGLLTLPWAAYWSFIVSHSLTPQGPFTSSALSGLGNVTDNERLWMTQYLLNASIDSPLAPATVNYGTDLSTLINHGEFRILQNYQVKFLVNDDGTFGNITAVNNTGNVGATKLLPLSIFPTSVLKFFNLNLSSLAIPVNGETNTYNLAQNVSSDGYSESGYATARLGPEERNTNWRLWGTDAPWVYSEIISTLDSSDAVTTTIRTSADTTWANNTVTSGSNPFNNLNIYIMQKDTDPLATNPYFFQRFSHGILSMNGSLQYFLSTGSSTWGDGGTPPSF